MDRRNFLRMMGIAGASAAASQALPMNTLASLATPATGAAEGATAAGGFLADTFQSHLNALAEDVAYLHGDLQHLKFRALHLPQVSEGAVVGLKEKQTILEAMLSTRQSQEMAEHVEAIEQTSEFLRAHQGEINKLVARGELQIPKLLDAEGAAIPEFNRQGLRTALDASQESAKSYYTQLQQEYQGFRTQISQTANRVFQGNMENMDELFQKAEENDSALEQVVRTDFAEKMREMGAYTMISSTGKFHEGPNQIVIGPAGKSKETLRQELHALQEALDEMPLDALEESVPLGANRLLLRIDYSDPVLAAEATDFLQAFEPKKTNLLARG